MTSDAEKTFLDIGAKLFFSCGKIFFLGTRIFSLLKK